MTSPMRLPFEQPHLPHMPPLLRKAQTHGRVHRVRTRVGHHAWLVTDYEEVRRLLADDRLGRSHPDPENAARSGESVLFGGPLGNYDTERADSARMRSLLQPHFSPRRLRALRPRVEALTTELLDDLAARERPVDLNEQLAIPLPILVICELLGVPYEDRTQFRKWSHAAADISDRGRSEQGLADLFAYGQALVRRKRRHPGDDVISRLCSNEGVSDDEIAALSMALLFAGHETTVVHIGMGALLLLANPKQHRALLNDTSLIPDAVEEMLRAPGKGNGGVPRYAHADIDIDDVTVRAGELILLDNGAANHDENVFSDPDFFHVTRAAGAHLTFGHGAHYCIGAPLARTELQEVFFQLIPRFPTMRLTVPVEQLRLRADQLAGGLAELPVTW